MKRLLLALLFLFAVTTHAGDPAKTGGMSDMLKMEITHSPKNATFEITLKNISGKDLRVKADPVNFHGSVVLVSHKGREMEYFEASYRTLLLTGALAPEPEQNLAAGASIAWSVPLSVLRDVHDNHFPAKGFSPGTKALARLDLLAVVPADRTYVENNARQASAKILLGGP